MITHGLAVLGSTYDAPRGTQCKRHYRDVLPTWVAKLASWFMNDPYKTQNLVYEWVDFSKFSQI